MERDELKDLLFTWEGRVNRAKWWGVGFGSWLASFLLFTIAYILLSVSDILGILAFVVFAVAYVGLVVAGVMVSIKRWHDRGKPGWWLFIAFVPIIGGLWALIELGFLPGEDGTNEWGPDPTDPATARR